MRSKAIIITSKKLRNKLKTEFPPTVEKVTKATFHPIANIIASPLNRNTAGYRDPACDRVVIHCKEPPKTKLDYSALSHFLASL
jgi:hypothetical protein